MSVHRPVRLSQRFEAKARQAFPVGGSAGGKPSWHLFEAGPLVAFVKAFGDSYDMLQIAVWNPVEIRFAMTHALPIFPPMTVYGALQEEGEDEWVELLDIEVDAGYFDLIANDPDPTPWG